MSYVIAAFVAQQPVLRDHAIPGATVVPLPQGYGLIPLIEPIRARYGVPPAPLTAEQSSEVTGWPLIYESWGRALSELGPVAYIEAELFGGVGMQAAVLWRGGAVERMPFQAEDAINVALRHIGVVRTGSDEFDALGLGRCRSTGDWLWKESWDLGRM